ncbi:MAG: dodecin family protein [Dehalococcoidales bacterium]|nr:dodecin family protein [Dehalococcoidales bacterium]
MPTTVYKVIELVGTSPKSWEDAAKNAIETASKTLRDLRIAEVVEQDIQLENAKVILYRTKIKLSFKYQEGAD